MARTQSLRKVDFEEPTVEASLKTLRQNLNKLRRQAHELNQVALEDCLKLAISLATPPQVKN